MGGADKAFVSLMGRPLIAHVLGRLQQIASKRTRESARSYFDLDNGHGLGPPKPVKAASVVTECAPAAPQQRIAINAGGDPARFATLAVPVWADVVPAGQGPLAGVLTGLTRAVEHWPGTTHVLTVPVDCPLLPLDLADRMTTASQNTPGRIVVAESAGRSHGTVALWPTSAAAVVQQSLTDGMCKLAAVQQQFGVTPLQFPYQGLDPFTNLNTPQDIQQLEQVLGR
jgi:molybdopterin-guanine dinucleotide biosynthesis protein A